jgi:hypothetical protein
MALYSRIFLSWTLGLFVFVASAVASPFNASDNGTETAQPAASIAASQTAPPKIPLDVQSTGSDSSGALLGFKLKEAVLQSSFFALTPGGKRFVLRLVTKPEFGDRPYLSSAYAVALYYQEAPDILPYFLDVRCGLVDAENVQAEINAIFDWTSDLTKKFHYLLSQ